MSKAHYVKRVIVAGAAALAIAAGGIAAAGSAVDHNVGNGLRVSANGNGLKADKPDKPSKPLRGNGL